jgi:N utilization substance protein A
LGKTDALLPRNEIIPGEQFKPGDRVQAFLADVAISTRGPQIYLSRTSPKYLMKLFEIEVPEIREGIVEIKLCAREPGARSKIAVISKDRDVDPVGACVGMKGIRVQNVIAELRGEKIDIIPWTDNSVMFVRSALAPADISSVRLDERSKTMEIMVEDDQLSLAIGRRGQNVRLAAQLTGWKLDIISKTKLQKRMQDALFIFKHIDGVNETLAQAIYQAGFLNCRQVADVDLESLQRIPGFSDEASARKLQEGALAAIEKHGDKVLTGGGLVTPASVSEGAAEVAAPGRDAKAEAEERLRAALREQSKLSQTETE